MKMLALSGLRGPRYCFLEPSGLTAGKAMTTINMCVARHVIHAEPRINPKSGVREWSIKASDCSPVVDRQQTPVFCCSCAPSVLGVSLRARAITIAAQVQCKVTDEDVSKRHRVLVPRSTTRKKSHIRRTASVRLSFHTATTVSRTSRAFGKPCCLQ